MKSLSIIAINICFIFMSYAQQGTLMVSIEKDNTLEGDIYIAVFTEDNFLRQPVLTSDTKMEDDRATATFENVDFGTYAISAYQDVNGNERLDRDEYGRPTEPWVFSGSSASMMPIWMDSMIVFNSESQSIKLKL